MTGYVKSAFHSFKNYFSSSQSQSQQQQFKISDGDDSRFGGFQKYQPLGGQSSHFAQQRQTYTNNNHHHAAGNSTLTSTSSFFPAARPGRVPLSTLQSSYYWPSTSFAAAAASGGNSVAVAVCRKRTADFAFKANHFDDNREDKEQQGEEEEFFPRAKRLFSSSTQTTAHPSAYAALRNHRGGILEFPKTTTTTMGTCRPLTKFTTAPEYRRKKTPPEVEVIDLADSPSTTPPPSSPPSHRSTASSGYSGSQHGPSRGWSSKFSNSKNSWMPRIFYGGARGSEKSTNKKVNNVDNVQVKDKDKDKVSSSSSIPFTVATYNTPKPTTTMPHSQYHQYRRKTSAVGSLIQDLNTTIVLAPATPAPSSLPTTSRGSAQSSRDASFAKLFYDIDETIDDIQIISEKILSPPGQRDPCAVNSFELETRPFKQRDKRWLLERIDKYREQNQRRNSQIDFEYKTMHVLKTESDLEADISARIRRNLTITDVIALVPTAPVLPEITDKMQDVIDTAIKLRNDSEVLVTAFNIQITRADLKTLVPCQWLNDNIINTYMDMLAERSRNSPSLPKVHVFTTFFYPKFVKEGYSNILKRWTRKVDIFSFDLLIFPIHLGVHWCLAAADLRKSTLTFFDSLLGSHMNTLKALLKYLASEMKERKKVDLITADWTLDVPKTIPTQENGSDCGLFTCKFAEYLSRDAALTFKQDDMNYYRYRMMYEIVKQDLMSP